MEVELKKFGSNSIGTPLKLCDVSAVSQPSSPERTVLIAVGCSIALCLIKLVAGLVGNSYALIADAIESFSDIIGGAIVWGGLRFAGRPASERYPYGLGKAEALSALIVAGIIFSAGIGIALEAIYEIRTPHHAPAPFTLGVLIAVLAVKELLYRRLTQIAKATESTALEADAWHHRADAITSLCAFIGISIALIGGPGWEPADDYAALAAAAIILRQAFRVAAEPVRELLDIHDTKLAVEIQRHAEMIDGVYCVEKVHVRKSGARYLADMHLWVSGEMNVRDAHALSHTVKDTLLAAFPSLANVLIHLEPADPTRLPANELPPNESSP